MKQPVNTNTFDPATSQLQYAILSTNSNATQAQALFSLLDNQGYTVRLTFLDDEATFISTQLLNQVPYKTAEKILTLVDDTASSLQLIDLSRNTTRRLTPEDFIEALATNSLLSLQSIH